MILVLALGCATQDPSAYEAYDPSAELAPASTSTAAPIEMVREYGALSLTDAPAWKAPKGSNVVGFTALTTGRWTYPGKEPGYASGTAACQAMGATHVCTADELRRADTAGYTKSVPADTMVWVDFGNRDNPGEFDNADSCAGYTYEGADARWTGQRLTYTQGEDGVALVIEAAPESLYDDACLKSLAVCAQVVPSGFECNDVRSIPCCI